jgi:DNA-directed RNA polymerase subunit RPC12/RpoP
MDRNVNNCAVCPACSKRSVALDLSGGRYVQCPECGADLVIKLKYYTLYVLTCILGALLLSQLKGLHGPFFVGATLIYMAVFLVAGAFLLRLCPLKLELNDKQNITKLRL